MNKEYCIDPRDNAGIRATIKELAASYTPEWSFDPANPDIGTVIGLIFASQSTGTIRRLNQALGKYQTEFVNMLSLPLNPAQPACGVVTMELSRDTVPGTDLPAGTKLLGERDAGVSSLVFETVSDIHITGSRLRNIIAVSPSQGKIIPIMDSSGEGEEIPSFTLFDFEGEGIGRNELTLYHDTMFNTNGELLVRATDPDGVNISDMLADETQYRWNWLSLDGFKKPIDAASTGNGTITLTRGEGSCGAIVLEAAGPVTRTLMLGSILFSSACDGAPPDFILHNATELHGGEFMPFGETAALFDECYLGQDSIFAQIGAKVTVSFAVDYREKLVTFTPQQEAGNLKVIKKKPRKLVFDTARTTVNKVILEYFNGLGWRALPCENDMGGMFAGTYGPMEFSFTCPDDWQPLTAGGHTGRCIRMRIEQAENCYLQPCMHSMPIVNGLSISYKYDGSWLPAQRIRRVSGTEEREVGGNKAFAAFEPLRYAEDGVYLGFNRKMNGGPVGLLFIIEPVCRTGDARFAVAYSTISGFAPLKVIDHTENFSATGTLMFRPPPDFAETEIEGVRRYWLRITGDGAAIRPRVEDIFVNAVEVHNVETLPEESFYVETTRPYMSFPIAARNILSCEVYVNEAGMHSETALREMAEDKDTRVSYNFLGDVSECFVRWTEVPDFITSKAGDRHYRIDRVANTIHFGDGVTVMAPRPQNGESFTVTARCTQGAWGNLPAGAINSAQGRLLHIGSINNPIDAWGGSDIESAGRLRQRGANILCSQNRLISTADFEREIRAHSPSIQKVRCMTDPNGAVSIAVLTKDYRGGLYPFIMLRDSLKQMLLKKCEAGFREDLLVITEPLYVTISVTLYIEANEQSFGIKNRITEHLDDFLDPMAWDIGSLPDEAQILFMLGTGFIPGAVRGFTATARWQDGAVIRECALDALPRGPFMIGVSGNHTVHM